MAKVEINIPSDKAKKINKSISANKSARLPIIGTLKTKYPIRSTTKALIMDRIMYGVTLPSMICIGFKGDARRISIVPDSFSRVMVMAVIIADMSIRITAISPGMKL